MAEGVDRQPPQDLTAEQSVLGGMLLSKDAVADVVDIPSAAVQAASDLGSVADASLIRGVARIEERVVVLLRLEAIVAEGASAISSY